MEVDRGDGWEAALESPGVTVGCGRGTSVLLGCGGPAGSVLTTMRARRVRVAGGGGAVSAFGAK
eukprot:4259231-Amphidinium_carterae.1